jgi:signal transduction histidine kinase
MLIDFISKNHDELVARTKEMVAKRLDPADVEGELTSGVPLFLEHFTATLRHKTAAMDATMDSAASLQGARLLARGYTVGQVVHNYGDLCQAITELADEIHAPITADEFHTLNLCLDNAIAEAVTEYLRVRDQSMTAGETQRSGVFAHELRNKLSAAQLGFDAIKTGRAPIAGSVAGIVTRSLHGLTALIDRTLLDVRVSSGITQPSRVAIHAVISDTMLDAALEANRRGILLSVSPVDPGIEVDIDAQILTGVLANLVQNAMKFTPRGGHVRLDTSVIGARVEIQIEDECGGLPPGKLEELFGAFQQRGTNRSGLGLGLFISRKGVEASGGAIRVRDIPGSGCVFTVDLPLLPAAG